MRKIPYAEARRLRYCTIICKHLLEKKSQSVDVFVESLLRKAAPLNEKLDEYIRTTGKMRTKAVARGYVDFCEWMGWLKLYGEEIAPTGYTQFIATIAENNDFRLGRKEKIGLFVMLMEKDVLVELLRSLKGRNLIRDYTSRFSEHLVESLFDWLVDLAILIPSAKTYGHFDTTSLGANIVDVLRKTGSKKEAIAIYSSKILKKKVKPNATISQKTFVELVKKSTKEMGRYTRSQWDPFVYSAVPIVLEVQLRLITSQHKVMLTTEIIQSLKTLSTRGHIGFKWDPFSERGYLIMNKAKR